MPTRECDLCHKMFSLPKNQNAEISLSLKYGERNVEEYWAEVCCPQCMQKINDGMYSGIERDKTNA